MQKTFGEYFDLFSRNFQLKFLDFGQKDGWFYKILKKLKKKKIRPNKKFGLVLPVKQVLLLLLLFFCGLKKEKKKVVPIKNGLKWAYFALSGWVAIVRPSDCNWLQNFKRLSSEHSYFLIQEYHFYAREILLLKKQESLGALGATRLFKMRVYDVGASNFSEGADLGSI